MSATLEFDTLSVADFMRRRVPGFVLPAGARAIGLRRRGELVAGAMFEHFTPHDLWMHAAAAEGHPYLHRDFPQVCFAYAFLVCKVDRVTGYIPESNTASRRLARHVGFVEEARLKGAAADGGDVLIHVLWKRNCKYI